MIALIFSKHRMPQSIATCIQQNLWFTSAAKSVLISPIAVSPTRNEIWIKSSHTGKARQRSALIKGRPLKINYFQSFWLWIASKHQEWFVPEFSCAEYLKKFKFRKWLKIYCSKIKTCGVNTHLLMFIVNWELKSLPFSDSEHCAGVKPAQTSIRWSSDSRT